MMTFQGNSSLPAAEAPTAAGSSGDRRRGPDAAGGPAHRDPWMGAGGGGHASCRQNGRRKCNPEMKPLSKSKHWETFVGGIPAGGSPISPKDGKTKAESNPSEKDIRGKLRFDKKYSRFGRTRTVIPPLVRPDNLHSLGLSKELYHNHPERPFILGYPERCELNACPAILFPSSFVLNGSSNFKFEKCKLSRPKVNYPAYNLPSVKDNQKSHPYPDPMVGAPRCFVHRVSELSSLEGETVRQEKLKKMRKPRKGSS